jgi:N-acyl-D-aspartate/D-glutamate deacylase
MNLYVDCPHSIRRSFRCHYDAQVTWDPLCTFSCYHGATSVIIGNCSLALGPVRRGNEERLAEFLSYVEAIPIVSVA